MKSNLNKVLSFILIFVGIIIGLLILMVCVAKIPREWIKQNMVESANYLIEKPMYYQLIKGHQVTTIDHYADAITLNIVYNLEQKNSLKSVLYSNYYGNNGNMETENLLKTVSEDGYNAESQYIRYWHGEMIILRLLLLVFNIKQIYILNAIVLIILTGILSYMLIKNKMFVVMIGLIVAMLVTNSYVVPFALEYISMYIVMLISSIILLHLLERKKESYVLLLFFLTGIFTCFFDFLTIETVTLLIPLIILLVYKYKDSSKIKAKELIKIVVKIALIWAAGYVLMWGAKWSISSIYLHENFKDVVLENAVGRIEKTKVYIFGTNEKVTTNPVLRNIYCLFPLYFFKNKNVIIFISLFILFTFLFFTRKEENIKLSIMILGLGLIPYIRYWIINGHSLLHYFFTYRAQMATLLALIVGSYYMVDKNLLRRKNKCKMKKN